MIISYDLIWVPPSKYPLLFSLSLTILLPFTQALAQEEKGRLKEIGLKMIYFL